MRLTSVIILAIVLTSCQGTDTGVGNAPASLPFVKSLHVGQSFQLPHDGSIIKFERVTQDSRCPAGAMCLWEGDGAAQLSIMDLVSPARDCTLHTTLGPRFVVIDSVSVSMKGLTPYPKINEETLPSSYVITLQIDTSNGARWEKE